MLHVSSYSQNPYYNKASFPEMENREVIVNYTKYDEFTYSNNLDTYTRIMKGTLAVFLTLLILPLIFAPSTMGRLYEQGFQNSISVRVHKEDLPRPPKPAVVFFGRRQRPFFRPAPAVVVLRPRPAPRHVHVHHHRPHHHHKPRVVHHHHGRGPGLLPKRVFK